MMQIKIFDKYIRSNEMIYMPSKNVTLNVDEELYDRYREFSKKKGRIISMQFEIMMEEEMGEGYNMNQRKIIKNQNGVI